MGSEARKHIVTNKVFHAMVYADPQEDRDQKSLNSNSPYKSDVIGEALDTLRASCDSIYKRALGMQQCSWLMEASCRQEDKAERGSNFI